VEAGHHDLPLQHLSPFYHAAAGNSWSSLSIHEKYAFNLPSVPHIMSFEGESKTITSTY
jgi:hypothetical protein